MQFKCPNFEPHSKTKFLFHHSCTESTPFRTIFRAEKRRFRPIFMCFQNRTKNSRFRHNFEK